jgi:hypothetical protein
MNTPSIAYNRQAYGVEQTQRDKDAAIMKEVRQIEGNPNLRHVQHIARDLRQEVGKPDPSVKSDT